MPQIFELWRYPIKSHGRETVAHAVLEAHQSFPWDRHWAIVDADHPPSFDEAGWAPCRHFLRGTRSPELAALTAKLDTETRSVSLFHPDKGSITFSPDDAAHRSSALEWISDLLPENGQKPAQIVCARGRGMSDTDYPSVSVMNIASHQAVVEAGGRDQIARWRGNIWIEGLPAWQEFDWIGKHIQLGDALLEVVEPIIRCRHTEANTETGARDCNTLAILRDAFDHTNFGVYAKVIKGGAIKPGLPVEVIE